MRWFFSNVKEKQSNPREEFNMKESQCYVSVSINHHQDLEKMLWNIIRSQMDAQWNTKQGEKDSCAVQFHYLLPNFSTINSLKNLFDYISISDILSFLM